MKGNCEKKKKEVGRKRGRANDFALVRADRLPNQNSFLVVAKIGALFELASEFGAPFELASVCGSHEKCALQISFVRAVFFLARFLNGAAEQRPARFLLALSPLQSMRSLNR
jgi:hypothetical protein